MSIWNDMLARHAQAIAAASNGPGEPVKLRRVDNGYEYCFHAVINRKSPTAVSKTGQGKAGPMFGFEIVVFIPFDCTGKAGCPYMPVKNDVLIFPTTIADAGPSDHPIVEVSSEDAGGFTVRVR